MSDNVTKKTNWSRQSEAMAVKTEIRCLSFYSYINSIQIDGTEVANAERAALQSCQAGDIVKI